jgi:hypothetical protein
MVKQEKNLVFDLGNYPVTHVYRCGYLDGNLTPDQLRDSEEEVVHISPENLELPIWRRSGNAGVGLRPDEKEAMADDACEGILRVHVVQFRLPLGYTVMIMDRRDACQAQAGSFEQFETF